MKVQANGAAGVFRNNAELETKKEQAKKAERSVTKTDSLEISAPQERSTAQLVDTLKSQIMRDVKAGIDSHRLDGLRQEIASGNYDANPSDVVRKILGQG